MFNRKVIATIVATALAVWACVTDANAEPAEFITAGDRESQTDAQVAGHRPWGVRKGILDREAYLPVIIRGWKALVGSVHPDGKLGWVQPVGTAPAPSQLHGTHEYAAGLFLSAAGEVYQLVKEDMITLSARSPGRCGL